MDAFGQQHGASSQPGCSYTQDFEDMAVYSGDHVNVYQQNLDQPQCISSVYGVPSHPEPTVNPSCRFGASANNVSYMEDSSGYLPSYYVNSQAQVLTPAGYNVAETPCLPYRSHDDRPQMEKPPFSYATLIAMALQNAPEMKLTSYQIIDYVVDHFPFYSRDQVSWQVSIKQTLYNSYCFKKYSSVGTNPRKGYYWTIDPNCDKLFYDCIYKGRQEKCRNCRKHS